LSRLWASTCSHSHAPPCHHHHNDAPSCPWSRCHSHSRRGSRPCSCMRSHCRCSALMSQDQLGNPKRKVWWGQQLGNPKRKVWWGQQ
jgi:hypothetical protein